MSCIITCIVIYNPVLHPRTFFLHDKYFLYCSKTRLTPPCVAVLFCSKFTSSLTMWWFFVSGWFKSYAYRTHVGSKICTRHNMSAALLSSMMNTCSVQKDRSSLRCVAFLFCSNIFQLYQMCGFSALTFRKSKSPQRNRILGSKLLSRSLMFAVLLLRHMFSVLLKNLYSNVRCVVFLHSLFQKSST
jgi:hypothetical protein